MTTVIAAASTARMGVIPVAMLKAPPGLRVNFSWRVSPMTSTGPSARPSVAQILVSWSASTTPAAARKGPVVDRVARPSEVRLTGDPGGGSAAGPLGPGLAVDAQRRIGEGLEAGHGDLVAAALADAVGARFHAGQSPVDLLHRGPGRGGQGQVTLTLH